MTRKQRRGVLIGTCLAVLAVAVGLILFAMRDSIVFFYSPSEVAAMTIAPGTRFRLGVRALIPVHHDGWGHYTEGADDIFQAFAKAGLTDVLVSVHPGDSATL